MTVRERMRAGTSFRFATNSGRAQEGAIRLDGANLISKSAVTIVTCVCQKALEPIHR